MRFRKMILWLLSVVVFAFMGCMGGCANYDEYTYDYNANIDKTVSVELIYYDNPTVKLMTEDFSMRSKRREATLGFESQRCTVVETLKAERIDSFAKDLGNIIVPLGYQMEAPSGQGIRITYEDGSFWVATWTLVAESSGFQAPYLYIGEFNADGTLRYYVGDDLNRNESYYMILAANYFNTKIEATKYN